MSNILPSRKSWVEICVCIEFSETLEMIEIYQGEENMVSAKFPKRAGFAWELQPEHFLSKRKLEPGVDRIIGRDDNGDDEL